MKRTAPVSGLFLPLFLLTSLSLCATPPDSLRIAATECPLSVDAGADLTTCGCTTVSLNGAYSGAVGAITVTWTASPAIGNNWLSDPHALAPSVAIPCNFTGLMTYTLTVASSNPFCTSSDAVVVNVTAPNVGVSQIIQATCLQGGAFVAFGQGGTGPWVLMWSNGYTGFNPTGLAPGEYYVTVTNAEGCTRTGGFPIAGPTMPNPTLNNASICGSGAAVTLAAGGGPFTGYTWSTGQSGNVITVNTPGTYTVTVSAANGCTGTAQSIVSAMPNPVPVLNMPQLCAGGTATLFVTGGPFTAIDWSNGQHTSTSIIISAGGTYTVTVTDVNGCTGTASQLITPLPNPAPLINGPTALCAGSMGTLSLSGGSFTTVSWSNGETGNTITVPAPGTYTVTVTGANGCTGTAARSLTVLPSPVPLINGPAAMCAGGVGALTIGGGAFASVNWSTGQSGNSIPISGPGTYGVTVTDANGCTGTAARTVAATPPLMPLVSGPPSMCPGGSVPLTVLNSGNYSSIDWSNGQNGATAQILAPDTYTVTVTAANGCTGTAVRTVASFPSPVPELIGPDMLCAGDVANLSVGSGPFTQFNWSTGQTGSFIPVAASGTYAVTVTDFNGCTATADQTVTVFPNPAPAVTGPSSQCAGGLATLIVNGGNFAAQSWSTGQTGHAVNVLPPGTFTVTVTDGNGCTGTASHVLTMLPGPVPGISGPASICAGATALLDAGTGFPAYQWSTGVHTQQISTSASGTFTVTVTATNGCTGTGTFTLNVLPQIIADAGPDQLICMGQSAGLTAAGGTQYDWNTGQTGTSISVTPTTTTEYNVTVSAPGACPASDIVLVSVMPVSATLLTPIICAGDSIEVGSTIFNQANPTGQVILMAANGCDSTVTVSLGFYPVWVQNIQTFTCNPALAGTTSQVLQSQFGCDSTIITTTLFDPAVLDTVQVQATTCDPAAAGTSSMLLTGADGCDSLVITTRVLQPSPTTVLQKTTCDPALAGTATQVFATPFGCDSTVVTKTVLQPSPTVVLQKTTCDPALAGTTTQVFATPFGCDSTVVTQTVLQPSPTVLLQKTTCNPALAGTTTQVFATPFGCDSTVVTHTLFDPATIDTTIVQTQTCDPAAAGITSELLQGMDGCDSLVITTTVLHPSPTVVLTKMTCNPALAGTVTQVLLTAFGCDSTVVTHTLFDPATADTTLLLAHTCDPAGAGTTSVLLSGTDGCDSLVITQTVLHPSPLVLLEKTTCNPAQAGTATQVFQTAYGCDSTVVINTVFIPNALDTTLLQASTCDPAAAGTTTLLLSGADGCDSLVITNTILHPSPMTLLQKTTCNPALAGTTTRVFQTAFGCDSTVVTNTLLLPSDTTYLNQTTCDSTATGVFQQHFQTTGGCDSLVVTTVVLAATGCDVFAVNVEGVGVSCFGLNDGQILITALGGTPPFQFVWTNTDSGASGSGKFPGLNETETIGGLAGGTYQVTISGMSTLGEDTTAVLVVEVPFALVAQAQATSDFHGFALSCSGAADGAALVTASGGTPPLDLNWSNGAQTAAVSGLTAGWQAVTVTDAHGCRRVDSLLLAAPPPLVFDLEATDESCEGLADGTVSAQWLSGGVQPLQFALNGGDFSSKFTWNHLVPGGYAVRARDANGCETGTLLASVMPGHQFVLLAGLDTTIQSGDTVLLSLWTSHPVDTVLWSPPAGIAPVSPISVLAFPAYSTLYSVTAIDQNGCRASDKIAVNITQKRHLYAPNVIAPDGSTGTNGIFTIYGDQGVAGVDLLRVYDRWGDLVFERRAFPANDPNFGWNGDYPRAPAAGQPAVYVYYAVVRLSDQTTVLLSGDVTVLR